jgi:hypothetical protein
MMSKFNKPRPAGHIPHQADIDRVIRGADTIDDRKVEAPDETEVRFTMTLPTDMAQRVDVARKEAGRLTRLSWIRMAVAEKLNRDGM